MNFELKKPLTAIAYIVAFLAIQTVIQLIVLGAEMAIKGNTPQLDSIGMLIAMGSFTVVTIILFAWLKWAPIKRDFIQSRPWMTLFWCFVASLGASIPSVFFQEQMPSPPVLFSVNRHRSVVYNLLKDLPLFLLGIGCYTVRRGEKPCTTF